MKYPFNTPLELTTARYEFDCIAYYCGDMLTNGGLVAIKKKDWTYHAGTNELRYYVTGEYAEYFTKEQIKQIDKTFDKRVYTFRYAMFDDLQLVPPFTLEELLTQLQDETRRS